MNYKETFIRLYKELENATNELEMIQSQNPIEDGRVTDERLLIDGKEIHIDSPFELEKYEISPKLIEANCEREIIMFWIELNMVIKRRDELQTMITMIRLSSDEAYDAWKEVSNKFYKK